MRDEKKITEEDREKRNPIARCKKLMSNVTNKIKTLFEKKNTKQLLEEKGNIKDGNGLKGLKVTPLSEKSNDEINKIMEEMEKNPMGPQPYSDEQLLGEILRRIGTDDELAKRSSENYAVNRIWSFHRTGRLVKQEDGTVCYYDDYKNEKGTYRTKIDFENGVIVVDSKKILDEEGNQEDMPQYYEQFAGDLDSRVVNKVKISKNDFCGITLKNYEKKRRNDFKSISIVEFDDNQIEVRKVKQIFENTKTILERTQNPYVLKEISQTQNEAPIISYQSIQALDPDKLYSSYYTDEGSIGYIDLEEKVEFSTDDWDKLKKRNPKAARYFENFNQNKFKSTEK